jgi:NAD(P)-dependent dehydrogenase (short-subunit alcohol dehydrogenase family)
VLQSGDIVIATAREPKKNNDLVQRYGDQVYTLRLDVTDYNRIHQVVQDVLNKFGRIDVLVNNAGFGITGATEAFTPEQVKEQFAANLLAPIEICRAILPHMRAQKSGQIFNISSIGGRVTSIGLAIYQSAKFGLSGFSEALSKEVAPLGIKVTAVEPGGIQTNWGGSSMTFASHVEGYENTVDTRVQFFRNGQFVAKSDPRKIAKVLLDMSSQAEPPVHLVLGSDAVAALKQTNTAREEEFQKWMSFTMSTDTD